MHSSLFSPRDNCSHIVLLLRTISVLFNLGAPICHVSSSAKRRDLGRLKYKIDGADLLLLTAIACNEILMLMTRRSTFKKKPTKPKSEDEHFSFCLNLPHRSLV